MAHQQVGNFATLRDRFGNHVRDDRLFDVLESRLGDGFGEASLGKLHQRAVEGTRNGKRNSLDTGGTAVFHELVHAGDRTGHHNLARAVDVRGHHGTHVLHGFAEFKNLGFVLAHDGGHRTGVLGTGRCHEFAAGTHQAEAFFEAETAGGVDGGVFAEGMPGHVVKGKTFGLEEFHHHGRHGEEGRLGIVGALEHVFRTFGHELREREAEDFVGLLHNLLGRFKGGSERLAHAHILGTLAREKQNRFRHHKPLRLGRNFIFAP